MYETEIVFFEHKKSQSKDWQNIKIINLIVTDLIQFFFLIHQLNL